MPPPVGQIEPTEQAPTNSFRKVTIGVLSLLILGVAVLFASLWITLWPASDEAVVATYTCDDTLSWEITTGNSTRGTFDNFSPASACQYHRVGLYRNDTRIFSVANFTDCRNFESDTDLFNGIEGGKVFPAGAPIVASMGVIDAVVPTPEPAELGDGQSQPGFQISTKSGLSKPEFITASRCLLDHRNELQDIFGQLYLNSGPLMWLALVDESAPYAEGDLPGGGQVFACKNGYTYRTSSANLFALAPGEPPLKMSESGFEMINDTQVAVIGMNGRLYEPDRTHPGWVVTAPYTDYRTVDLKTLPALFSDCTDGRGVSLQAFLESLSTNGVLYQSPQPQ